MQMRDQPLRVLLWGSPVCRVVMWFFAASSMGVGASSSAAAGLKLASPFVDHMVLQREKPIVIWGSADPNAAIAVQFGGQNASGRADADGRWRIELRPAAAGGPYTCVATSGSESAGVSDVLVGDVWLCSGQSNMQMSLKECDDGKSVAAGAHPKLRLGSVGAAWAKKPQSDAKIRWTDANPKDAADFSAVAFYFAHELQADPAMAEVPIGLLEDCLGATVIESWLPQEGLSGLDPKELQMSMFGIGPTQLYNGMIAPLGALPMKGVIWYQGEGNAGEPERYQRFLPILFQTWRKQFGDPQLPFLVVQLPDYATDWGGVYWQWIRAAQAAAVAQTPGTAIAIGINTNDGYNLHPPEKHVIGSRLALLARQTVYKEKIVGRGPVFLSAKPEASTLRVSFNTDGDGLASGDGPVDGFSIAGEDGVYRTAEATIDGDAVLLTAPGISAPLTVRYAWAGVPCSTLTNRSGLPAAPFRTDTQPVSKGHGEAQRQLTGYRFKGKDYQVEISGDGRVTSLIVGNQQLLSNAPAPHGGSSIGNRSLSKLQMIAPDTLMCSNHETSFTIEFKDDGMRWTIANVHPKDNVKFHVALSPAVTVSSSDGSMTLKRKNASLVIGGVERITTDRDIAADDGKVLEIDLPRGETRTVDLTVKQ